MRTTAVFFAALAALLFLFAAMIACDDDDDNDNDASGVDDDQSTGDDDSAADDDDDNDDDDSADDDNDDDTVHPSLIPGPDDPGYDEDLEAAAEQRERQFHVFNAYGMDISADVSVSLDEPANRALIEDFILNSDSWDFAAVTGLDPFDVVTEWQFTAGLYSGVGIAADAYRYGVLRDEGYPQADIDRARDFLQKAIEALKVAYLITGTPGVIARGYVRTDIPGPGPGIETTPLFDEEGNPLPAEKNNGTNRADNSVGGLYPNYVWVDSCSRDQYIGWAAAFAAVWEVIRDDPSFDDDLKADLQDYARELALALSVVRESGFDLEIPDADGRTTYHGYLNENNYDRIYIPWLPIKNGMYSLMAIGILGALAYVAEDEEVDAYLYDTLIDQRQLDLIARQNQIGVDLWVISNYSSVNMAFQGAWLAHRYLDRPRSRNLVKLTLAERLYDKPMWHQRQAKEIKQSLFDFVYAASLADASVYTTMSAEPDAEAMAHGLETLADFPVAPFWEYGVVNCDEDEIAAGHCLCVDGETELDLMPILGRGDKVVSVQPVPIKVRPTSNYYWRSNPYEVNGGSDGTRLLPAVDFLYAYWLGRWTR
ncbi:MAG: hypothetical protein GX444_08080 [Myxococcales bacterium]|nr:hypothetical protein [Myxococcales bacterium]